ncbi:hypothetical protein [Solibaculum intestinale]|uniref:Transcriptional regulator n=1 Tax=Solibaculum intestinale TaxID=3133165 RepID=A0ABV1E6B3_9FIRM
MKLSDYGITVHMYRELHEFCLQYNEKKAKLYDCYCIGSPSLTGQPRGSADGSVTSRNAEKAIILSADIAMIEQAAVEAGKEEYQNLLKAVTCDLPGYVMRLNYGMTWGENKFRNQRKLFFIDLAKRKGYI